jgi:hypothetical protein
MSRPHRRDALTGDMFVNIPRPAPPTPASMDFRTQLSHLVSDMLAAAVAADPLSDRYHVAAMCSRLAGKEVSKAMLDGYTAESRDAFNLPLWLVPALETACNSTALTEWLAAIRGGRLVLGPAALDAEIGRLQGEMEATNDRLKELKDLRRRVR